MSDPQDDPRLEQYLLTISTVDDPNALCATIERHTNIVEALKAFYPEILYIAASPYTCHIRIDVKSVASFKEMRELLDGDPAERDDFGTDKYLRGDG